METNVTKKGKRKVGNGIYLEKPKYKIAELLYNLPYSQAKQAKNQLPRILGIPRQTLAKWLTITIDDKYSIPSNEFLRLCVFFNIEPLEMINYPIKEILIIDETQKEQNQLAKKIGLVK
ncbi:hypothetical protein ACSN7Q_001652 [Flavobacterium psychrophilum]